MGALVGLLMLSCFMSASLGPLVHVADASEVGESQTGDEGVVDTKPGTTEMGSNLTSDDESLVREDDSILEDGAPSEDASPSGTDAPSDSEDEPKGPPNPTHMWSPENMPEDYSIMLFSSIAPYWATNNGQKAFYDGYGALYASPALKVIDVSEHNGPNIDWDAVARGGVDAAILRIGWGDGGEDLYFERNVAEVRRVGLPYGVYLYSYAYDANFARGEANATADLLDRYNCKDLSLPIYYDIEKFSTWDGHAAPSDPGTYEQIIRTYIDTMAARGYTNVHVYTYRSYLQNELNSTYIWQRTSWIAEYGPRLNVTNDDYSGQYGWQYTSTGSVSGVSGNVDISAFSASGSFGTIDVTGLPLAPQIANGGVYYIDSLLKPSSSVDIAWGSVESGARTHLYSYNKSDAQKFEFVEQGDGSYAIRNVNSGLVLDVQNGEAGNGAVVQQYEANGTKAQKWFVRDSGDGYCIQSALGNWVLDISGGLTADGTPISLQAPNGSDAQKFMLASGDSDSVETGKTSKISSAADSGLVFDIDNASSANNARLQIFESNGSDAQGFRFSEIGNGLYTISSVASGKAIEVTSGLTNDGAPVAQYDANGTNAQCWAIRNYGSGAFSLVNLRSGKAIDIPSGNLTSGNKLQIFTPNGTSAQLWKVEETSIPRERLNQLATANKDVLEDGGSYFIQSAKSPAKTLDVQWGALSTGTNIWLFSSNYSSAQRWTVSIDDIGYVTLTNELTGKVLDVDNGVARNNANVQQWDSNGSWAQKWIPVRNANGSVTLLSAIAEGYALDLDNASTSDMTNVQLFSSNGTDAQSFIFSPAPMVVSDGEYTISSSLNRNCMLDVAWGSLEDGANVWLYEGNGTDVQRWIVTNETDGTLKFINVATGKSLDLMWGGTTSGTNVWQYSDNGTQAQRWRAIKNSDGSITLRSVLAPSLVLDVSGGIAASQANVQVFEQNSTAAQKFYFEKVK